MSTIESPSALRPQLVDQVEVELEVPPATSQRPGGPPLPRMQAPPQPAEAVQLRPEQEAAPLGGRARGTEREGSLRRPGPASPAEGVRPLPPELVAGAQWPATEEGAG